VTPMVLLSRLAHADRPGGVTELVGRLQALSPAMRVGVMVEQSRELGSGFDAANVIVHRPTSPGSDPAKWIHFEEMAAGVRETLTPLTLVKMTPSAPVEDPAHPTLLRLKRVSDQLRDRSRDSEILNVVLGFASETFSRVAIFMLREASVDAIAQRGLERSGGPSDEQLSMLSFPRDDPPEVFRRVLERRTAIASKLVGPSDERLAMLLGTSAAKQAYVAPIESGGCVAALLYADNQPIGDSIPDTTALEIVLQEAGLALDRALLHRALAEADRALLG
jgi:hypothetical protein